MVAQTSVNTAHCCRLKSLWISCCKDWQMPLFLIKFPACDAWLFLQIKLFTESPKSSDKFALQRAFYKKYAVFFFQTLMKKRIECFLLLFQEYTNKSSLSVISVDVFFFFFLTFCRSPGQTVMSIHVRPHSAPLSCFCTGYCAVLLAAPTATSILRKRDCSEVGKEKHMSAQLDRPK